jgi:L-galactose dehydrogenase
MRCTFIAVPRTVYIPPDRAIQFRLYISVYGDCTACQELPLQHRPLGKTGLFVSPIGFGASPLGDVFGAVPQQQGRAAVHHAIDTGINLFDVSPYYGLTLAEDRLGDALLGRRDEVVLATKCGRYGSSEFDFSADRITREFEASLRRLKTDYVDLLQVHDVEFGSIAQIIDQTLPVMRKLQEQGKVRFIGVTGYWPGLLAEILAQTPVDTVLNYCHSNLLMDDMDRELTPAAVARRVGLLNASPLHMGLLSGGNVPDWHPAPKTVKQAAASINAMCARYGQHPATVALRYSLQHPDVVSTFIGFSSTQQVDDALLAMNGETPAELLAAIHALAAPVFNTVWASGLIENQPAALSQNTSHAR